MEKTRMRILPTLGGLIALVALVTVGLPLLTKLSRDNERAVVISVNFTPQARTGKPPQGRTFPDHVAVEWSVGRGSEAGKEKLTRSPWTTTVYPRKNELVEVRASQVYGETLTCTALQQGQPPVTRTGAGPTEVICRLRSL